MKTVLLSAKPEPVTPAPELAATVCRVGGSGAITDPLLVQVQFLAKGAAQFSVRLGPEYARALGRSLLEAAK